MFFEYVDTGSWTSSTYKSNENDFKGIKFRQRVARDMTGRNLNIKTLGQNVSMPVALSPIIGRGSTVTVSSKGMPRQPSTEIGVTA